MIKNKKLLLVGGGYADIPLIISAKKLGYYVITTGNRPDDLGHCYSDEYRNCDFSDCEAILALAKKLNISAICPCCNDFSALSAAYTADRLGLPGHDSYQTATIIHHKDKFREFAGVNNIPSPRAMGFSDLGEAINSIEALSFPSIIKPVDLTGGKGISVVNNKREALVAIKKAFAISKAKRIVSEEYICGSRHGFSSLIYKGKVSFYFCDNEHYYLNPYLVSAASTPSTISDTVKQKLCFETERIASLLSLKDGIFHVQFILKNNEPEIIEICRRPPGDLYIKLVEYATGIDYPNLILKGFTGMNCSEIMHSDSKRFITRHCIMSAKQGKLQNITFDKSVQKNIIHKFMWWKKGDIITDYLTAKFGIVFLEFQSMEEMLNKTKLLNELIKVQVE
jgi:biotin carboxylase